jgi:hypothetical protein
MQMLDNNNIRDYGFVAYLQYVGKDVYLNADNRTFSCATADIACDYANYCSVYKPVIDQLSKLKKQLHNKSPKI